MRNKNNIHASSDVASLHKVRARQCSHQAVLSEKSATGDTDKSSRRGKKNLKPSALNILQFNISGLRHKKTEGDVTHLPSGQLTDVQRATIWHTGRKFTIYNVYSRPKTTCDFSFLQTAQYEKTICAGDFNGHSPEWGYTDHNSTGTKIEELCESSNLSVLQNANSPPTLLHRAHLTLSRPDLTICSSDIENSCRIEVIDDMGSDHRPIITRISTPPALTHSQRTRWNFRKANWAEYRKTTEELLSCLEETEDTDVFNEQVTSCILKAASQHIPQGSRKNFKPFWNGEIQAAVTEREKARQLLEKSP